MKKLFYCLLGFLCLHFSACSTYGVYDIEHKALYSAETDPDLIISKNQILEFELENNATIPDKKLKKLLGNLMVKEGFKIVGFNVKKQYTPCYIRFVQNTSSSQYTGSRTTFYPQITNTYIPSAYGNSRRVVTSTTQIPISSIYTQSSVNKSIIMGIYCLKDNSIIHFGTSLVFVDKNDYEQNQMNILTNLVKLLGKDFNDEWIYADEEIFLEEQ